MGFKSKYSGIEVEERLDSIPDLQQNIEEFPSKLEEERNWVEEQLKDYYRKDDFSEDFDFSSFLDKETNQDVIGIKNFVNGLKLGGLPITYNAEKNTFVFPANAIFQGGIAWNTKLGGFNQQTITSAVIVDNDTIGKDVVTGALYVKKGVGLDEEALKTYLNGNQYAKISNIPTNNTQLFNGAGYITGINSSMVTSALGYTPISTNGGTISGDLTVNGTTTINGTLASASTISANSAIRATGFLRVNTVDTSRSYAYIRAEIANASNTQKAVGHIGTNYSKGDDLTLQNAVDAIAIYRGVVGIGGTYTYDELYENQSKNISLALRGALSIGGSPAISYDTSKNAIVLSSNLIIDGGIAWNTKLEGYNQQTITAAVLVDDKTIGKDAATGALYVKGGVGLNESQLGDYLTHNNYAKKSDIPSLSGYATESFVTSKGYITNSISGDFNATGMVRGTAYLSTGYVQISSNIDSALRTNIFGDAGSHLGQIKAFRTASNAVGSLSGTYAAGLLFAMGDTHGFIQLPSAASKTGEAIIGGGVGDEIRWSAKLLHSLNYSSYALPKTGGTLSGALTISTAGGGGQFAINNTSGGESYFFIQSAGENRGAFTTAHASYGTCIYNASCGGYLGVTDVGVAHFQGQAILHSGNVGSYALPINGGTVKGATTVTSRLQINAPDESRNFGYVRAESMMTNRCLLHIGASNNYGTNNDAIAIYRNLVGIGRTFTSDEMYNTHAAGTRLYVAGNIVSTGKIAWNSSRVLKNIVGDAPTYMSLDALVKIKPYRYTWKDGRDNLVHAGGIADEVLEVLPEVIMTDTDGIHSMDYGQAAFTIATSLTLYVDTLVKEIKELKEEIKRLKEI